MPSTLERSDEPNFHDIQRQVLGNHSLANREDVAVIVRSAKARRLQAPAKGAADAVHLVGDYRFAVSRSAEHDAAFELAAGHRFRRGADEQRIIDRRFGAERAEIFHFVPERRQKRPNFLFVVKSGVIGTNGDLQGPQHMAREIGLSSAEMLFRGAKFSVMPLFGPERSEPLPAQKTCRPYKTHPLPGKTVSWGPGRPEHFGTDRVSLWRGWKSAHVPVELEFNEESGRSSSVQFSSEFVEPDFDRGPLLGTHVSEHDAHAEAGVRVDDRAAKLTRAAAVADAEADAGAFGKRVDGIDVAAARAQFRDACGILHAHDLRFSDKSEARSRSSHDVGGFA